MGSGFTPLLRDPSVGLGQSKVVACASLLLLLEKGCPPSGRGTGHSWVSRGFLFGLVPALRRSVPHPGFKASGPGPRPGLAPKEPGLASGP